MTDNTPMDFIIKPTEACNFACTFCSSTMISDDHYKLLDIDYIFKFLTRFPKTNTLIINGGDPLMVKPKYYWDIIEFLDEFEMDTTISFTSNLWAFYKNPEPWIELFKHKRVGVTTSFNYGDTRRITKDRVFTENDFWKVSDMFLKHIGYRPNFISVITDENEDSAISNVRLAKSMNVECKLNYGMASGDLAKSYQLSKIYKIYVDVYKQRLTNWEYNTKQMVRRLSEGTTTCPQSRTCDQGIRAINPGGDYYSCGAFGDDQDKPISFIKEMGSIINATPLSDDMTLDALKSECYSCPMFKICNGCKKTIKDMKAEGIVEDHCTLMKTLADDIISINETADKYEKPGVIPIPDETIYHNTLKL